MDFTTYILPELLILIPVLYAIGYAIKKNAKIADENIPLILCGMGVVLSFLYILSTTPITGSQAWGAAIFAALTQGILCAAAAVLSNQVVKQGTKSLGPEEDLDDDFYDTLEQIVADYNEQKELTVTTEIEGDLSDGSTAATIKAHTEELLKATEIQK